MVRESRHLWVGNLPENIKEEEIRDYFSSYGRVEKVKLLTKTSPDGAKAAFVDFVDIRSATKANEASNRIGERDLRTNFNEPGANKSDFNRGQQVHRLHGYPPGLEYRPPVVIYAAPPGSELIHSTAYRAQIYQRNDRRIQQQQYQLQRREQRGRSPGSRGGYGSDGNRSPSSGQRSRVEYSSDSDSGSGKSSTKNTVLVRHLGARTSDSSLEEALYHEFKKVGEIINIRIKGSGSDRRAYVQFSSYDEAEQATLHSGKSFQGDTLKVTIQGERRSREEKTDGLVYDPYATRTIFVGNLEKTLMHGELRSMFEKFGDVVDVDIKKMQTGITTYAFVQYIDINGATLAKNKMDRQFVGDTRVKVGYGRGTPTNSLWVGNLPKDAMEHQVSKIFHSFGYVQRCLIDKFHWQALVRFETIESCTRAFADMHGKPFMGRRLAVDYASPSCRDGFYSRMERKGLLDRRQLEPSPTPPDVHMNFQNVARGGAFQPRGYAAGVTQPAVYQPNLNPALVPQREYREPQRPSYERYTERPKSNFDYEKELRDYGYGRDRNRDRRDFSPMSRSSSSPPRRRLSRDSISPVSVISDRRVKSKIQKKKKRKLSSPPVLADEPLRKREKRKKKEKKEKVKKVKANKGTMDFGYDNDVEEDRTMQVKTSKDDLKREKKERKKALKAEKARKKAEKKQRKLEKLKTLQAKLSSIEAAVEQYDAKHTEDKVEVDALNDTNKTEPDSNDTLETISQEHDSATHTTEDGSMETGVEPKEEMHVDNKPDNSITETNDAQEVRKAVEPEKETVTPDVEKVAVPRKTNSSKPDESSDSSSSSSSDSEDSDDSSDGDDDDRDYKHRSYKEREAIARRETERREPKAYRQNWESTYDKREHRSDRSPDKYRDREHPRPRYADTGRRSPPASYGGRRGNSRSSDGSRSPLSRRSKSRSPYSKHTSPYDRRKNSPVRRGTYNKTETDSRNGRLRRSSSPPPPPPPAEKTKYSSNATNSTSSAGSNQNADTLLDLLRRFPVLWQGLLGLKNDTAAVQMHFLSGNFGLAESSLPRSAQANEVPPPLRISQRMKLEASQLEGVDKRIEQVKEHCMLLALPCGRDPLDVHAQTRALKTGFITYLQQKQAAGIVNINTPDDKQVAFVVHIFPPCDFSQGHLARVAPDLLDSAADSGHLMVLITPA